MNIQDYYQKIRIEESGMEGPDVWVTSLPTRNGGVGGRVMRTPVRIAARMIVEGTARRASECEARRAEACEAMTARRSQMEFPSEYFVPGATGGVE